MADDHLPDVYLRLSRGLPGRRGGARRPRRGGRRSGTARRAQRTARQARPRRRRARRGRREVERAQGPCGRRLAGGGTPGRHARRSPPAGSRRPSPAWAGSTRSSRPAEPRRASRRPRPHQPSRPPSRSTFSSQMRVIAARTARAASQPTGRRRAGVAQLLAAAGAGDDDGVRRRAARGLALRGLHVPLGERHRLGLGRRDDGVHHGRRREGAVHEQDHVDGARARAPRRRPPGPPPMGGVTPADDVLLRPTETTAATVRSPSDSTAQRANSV